MHDACVEARDGVKIPLMFDSTEWEKMEAGLEHAGGKVDSQLDKLRRRRTAFS